MSVKPDILQLRNRLLISIREYFQATNFIEVNTPILIKTPALEDHIDAIQCGNRYLRTSPELHMKRLLQTGYDRIYQIGSSFRDGEHGQRHNPEFTMVEWYVTGFDYRQLLDQVNDLMLHICKSMTGESQILNNEQYIDLSTPWDIISVADAFQNYAGMNVGDALNQNCYEEQLLQNIEPEFSPEKPTVLIDFPIDLGALARAKPDNPEIAERWELYIGGMELANAYSELTDAKEQRHRFEKCLSIRAKNKHPLYPIDEDFLATLETGIPECAGCALGLDRLLMLFSNEESIEQVITFLE